MSKTEIDVLLTTEGTYPTSRGGVGTWCDMLVRSVPGIRYHIYTILGTPHLPLKYVVPDGVQVTRVPMWGTEEPTEHLHIRFSTVYARKVQTTGPVIKRELVPLFDQLLASVLSEDPDGRHTGRLLYEMYQFFHQYDYQEAFKSREVWDFFLDGITRGRWTRSGAQPTLQECLQTFGWLYRFLIVLNTPVPKADVTHSSAAAFCGIPGVLAKLEHRVPFLLTEHGVYLREQYLHIGRSGMSPFNKEFLLGLVRAVVSVNYAYADLVSPVAAFNGRWQQRFGVPKDRIRVIYNGIDPQAFTPRPRPEGAPPTAVLVGRIDPVKDIHTFLRAAALVRKQLPEARFFVYGGVSVPHYYQSSLALKDELGLGDAFVFAGHTNDVNSAYASGDVVVSSSISEGFPYAVIEAMMAGRPIVATDVGGTREAIEGAGILVQPQDPQELADALLRLFRDPDLRLSLAEEARERASTYFSTQRFLSLYRQAYEELARKAPARPAAEVPEQHRLLALHRAKALAAVGRRREAIEAYRDAAAADPAGLGTPVILLEIAQLYLELSDVPQCHREMQRAEALAECLTRRGAA